MLYRISHYKRSREREIDRSDGTGRDGMEWDKIGVDR